MPVTRNWRPIYREFAQVVGPENTLKIAEQFGGMQVTFPKRLLTKQAENRLLWRDYQNGATIEKLAHQYDYSERTVRRILQKLS
ncbi:hypothetical protein IV38_GL001024 [Lactobacillus selangorensis]|uniref:Mor transcription activator domain-containing protein n=1 Tax=Lactobacillus selangorensis TaxID=81857 RepID=A0A0R2G7Z8_9LACO|nr:Mor transcription activator family protein [Lactobacillus selangorensis]KRN28818.1 hypothetical protein IV38_GL001024 [Lactobacillus selangorensis]KRN32772.1 hypothetical protein IV40_GL000830 [Lactobacillus selangorensis]